MNKEGARCHRLPQVGKNLMCRENQLESLIAPSVELFLKMSVRSIEHCKISRPVKYGLHFFNFGDQGYFAKFLLLILLKTFFRLITVVRNFYFQFCFRSFFEINYNLSNLTFYGFGFSAHFFAPSHRKISACVINKVEFISLKKPMYWL